jgi:FixJ family two-component response regulator
LTAPTYLRLARADKPLAEDNKTFGPSLPISAVEGVGLTPCQIGGSWRFLMVEQSIIVGVVDDDPLMRQSLEHLLSAKGFQTEQYASAEAFILAAKTSKAACLLVDIHLGDITGVELARELAAIDCIFPVIFMSGSDDMMVYQQAMDCGCVAFLHKPFPADQLVESIRKATQPLN